MSTFFGLNATTFVAFTNNLIKQQYYYGSTICIPLGNRIIK